MGRLRLVALALPLAVVCAAPAQAQDAEEAQGQFTSVEVSVRERVLVLSGNRRFGIPGDVYARYQAVLDGLKPGDAVVFTHAQGRLVSIRRQADVAAGSRRKNVSARFDRLVTTQDGQRRWVVLATGQQLLISDEVYQRHSRTLTFLKSGDPIRLTVEGGWVIDVASGGGAAVAIDPEVEDAIVASRHGDVVTINGELYRFLGANLVELRVQPRIPGTEPPSFLEGASRTIPLEQVKTFDNPRLREQPAGPDVPGGPVTPTGDVKDAFSGVRVGDTVGIDFEVGQITALTDTHFTWRVWRNDEWTPPEEPRPRASVTSGVRVVSLPMQQTVAIEGGELHLKVSRRYAHRDGGLVFEIEASHAIPKTILVGTKLRFLLGDLTMTSDSAPLGAEELALPSLFEAQVVKVKHVVQFEGAFDGRVELVVSPENRLSVSSPEARGYLLQALEDVATARDPEGLARVYVAAGRNGDRAVCQLLVSRALAEPEPLRRQPILDGLEAFGELTPKVILEDLFANERNLETTRLDRGQLKRTPLPSTEKPRAYKRRLIDLLAEVPGALRPPYGGRLFDLYLATNEHNEPIEAAFSKRPAEAVASLLDVATSTTSASSAEEIQRAERAAGMLQRLGPVVLDEILKELRRREIAVDALQRAIEQSNGQKASEIVGLALSTLIQDDVRKRRQALDQEVERARGLIDQKELMEAATVLRSVLAQDRGHGPALEALPGVLLQIADGLRVAGDRAAAGAHYEEALTYLPPGEQPRTKAVLAELLLAAISEEIEENAVRAAPNDLAAKVRAAARDERLTGPEVSGGWVEIALTAETKGYVRTKCVVPAGPDTWVVKDVGTPFEAVDGLLTRAAELSPTISVRCGELRGRVYARDAKALYEAENYAAALPLFAKASELAPTDERLSLEWSCWIKAYKRHFFGMAVILLLMGGVAAMQMFARPKRVKWQGDYKHYGANRAQRERDLEVDEAAAGDALPGDDAPPPGEGGPP